MEVIKGVVEIEDVTKTSERSKKTRRWFLHIVSFLIVCVALSHILPS
jgi:hypothetical protein